MALGELERLVMTVLWGTPETALSVREVAEHFPDHAYTTIMTVLHRLVQKGFVVESRQGRANLYRCAATKPEYVASLMAEALLDSDDKSAALTHFAAAMNTNEREILSQLLRRLKRP